MKSEATVFIEKIDALIQAKHLLKHDFYQAWSRGELSMDCLREYAKEYYQHVKAFRTYLAAVLSGTSHAVTWRILFQNLVEEEAGSPNHPELWKNFARALGASEEEIETHRPSAEMEAMISTFHTICSRQTTAEGISVLYAYESQIPDICVSKIEGLKERYGMQNPEEWKYFSVHIDADKEHASQERSLLKNYLNAENQERVNSSVNLVLDKLWNFLSGMCRRYNIY